MKANIRFQPKPLYYCLTLIMFASGSGHLVSLASAGKLPPPPRTEADLNQVYKLYLELVVNDYSTRQIVPILVKGDDYYIEASKIAHLDITLPESYLDNSQKPVNQNDILALGFATRPSDWVNLSSLNEAKFEYLSSRQVLVLNLPPTWMPTQMLGRDSWYKPEKGQSGIGILNNYDIYMNRPDQGGTSTNVFLEQRFFSPYGVLKNSGIYTRNEKVTGPDSERFENKNGYRRYDTNYQFDHQDSATSILVGDVISGAKNSWGNSVRLGGIQIKRDFGTRPDLITYPLPQFMGQAALPSTIDLIINGQKSQSTDVQSGPFVINNLPYMTGRGEAVIVTTDAVGRQVSTAVPFYVSNSLLKPGLIDYSVSAGQIREDFGLKDFAYGQFVTSIDARYGIYDWLTLESRAEISQDIQLVGLGSVIKLANWGVLSSSYVDTRSDAALYKNADNPNESGKRGAQYTVGYSYNQNRFGFSVNHTNRDAKYADFSRLNASDLISINSNKITTAQTYFSTSKSGTFGVGYIETSAQDFENKLLNLSWAPVLPFYMRGSTVSLSSSHDFIKNAWSAGIQISIPLFKDAGTLNTGYTKDFESNYGYVNYNRSIPSGGGFGVDLTRRFNEDKEDLNQARLSYRNQYLYTDFGVNGIDNNYNYWLGLSGSFVAMREGVFASSRLGESFALIDTNKVADIPVKFENSLIGRSNRNGYIFVPSVTPYYTGKYSIDPLNLPSSYNATLVEQRVAAKRGSGIKIDFPINHSISANVYLLDQHNQPLPVGSVVHRATQQSSYVGIDGIAFLENLESTNQITVQLADERICKAEFEVDIKKAKDQIVMIENVICKEVAQ
ncbi:outer membrane usher protein [Acinetobacter calcoaceticus]|uniref:Outer membrane usher protein n=1 Tax=Acinetobacter calcoaceticus TaxID=471 RepID=A0A4R1XLG7_ACICA|nr:outer membrane usher protein [Acinetobacter calcoaceticus]